MKLLGAVLILASGVSLGCLRISSLHSRLKTLEALCGALDSLSGEMDLRAAPLPELCASMARELSGQAARFFLAVSASLDQLGRTGFSELWKRAAEQELPSLTAEEREEWIRLGRTLGRYPIEQQIRAIRGCCQCLEDGLENVRRKYPEAKKLGLGLAAAASAALVIILI